MNPTVGVVVTMLPPRWRPAVRRLRPLTAVPVRRPPPAVRSPPGTLPARARPGRPSAGPSDLGTPTRSAGWPRSEEHTSELQSRGHLVCRLLLEKKKYTQYT